MEILVTVAYIVACVLLFSLAIAIHEFGHFIVALKLGLRVERFSIGFGPALWKKTVSGVEYRLSAIPLGGYVSIPDIDPEGTKKLEGAGKKGKERGVGGGVGGGVGEGSPRVLIPAWKEILVAFAGPAMNIVLAVVLAVLLALVPSARFGELPSVLGGVMADGAAEKAGLRAGDRIVSVGGHPVSTWTEMQTEVQISGGRPTEFVIEREAPVDAAPSPRRNKDNSSSVGRGGGAASTGKGKAGLLRLQVIPEKNATTGAYYIMAYSVTNATGAVAWMPARNPLRQLAWDAGSIFRVLKGLVTPKEAKATAGALGGPVMIAEGIYQSLRRSPWDGVGFLRFLNVNLAVLNLLPLPVLDGGLIFFAFLALVFRRRVPEKVVTFLSMAFMYLLFGLMGILILKDSWRSWKIHTYVAPTNTVDAAPSPRRDTVDAAPSPRRDTVDAASSPRRDKDGLSSVGRGGGAASTKGGAASTVGRGGGAASTKGGAASTKAHDHAK